MIIKSAIEAMIALGICVIGAVIITSLAMFIWKINQDD
jgi:hypothetical protein